ncbi:serine hydrolase [Patescibacteria group bacterium]|nr:serine hydrolase [Patescibacteria group bacterium]MBU1563825.1 serine hydrolase [Patescibacteria group bacterium]
MLIKVITTILVLLNPLGFLMADSVEPLTKESIVSIEKWGQSLASALWTTNPNFLPIRNWEIEDPQIDAKAAIIFNLDRNKILYQKETDRILPIASLTKIMTALIVLENLDLERVVTVSEKALTAYGTIGGLRVNEKLTVKDLLHVLLMESSNDAAIVLAEEVELNTGQLFVNLMNQKVDQLELTSTRFSDPSGYKSTNISTVKEIIELVKYSFNQPIVWQIMKTPEINISDHHWVNTDELLNRLPNIIGGKTGYTLEAQGCLIIVFEQSKAEKLITVVLGAQQRFLETEKLINWVERAYQW